ncbi:MAG: hypothetical protein OEM03_07175 [Chromatiales bacterium]|nr:hypothetical protein [Chromatiales bacterium]
MNTALIRVLLAIDTATPSRGLLEVVAGLGLGTQVSLQAAFFEDQGLLESASLSCAREVSHRELVPRALDRQSLERQILWRRETLKRHFLASARPLAREHQFRSIRGPTGSELLREAREHDVLILGRPGPLTCLPSWMGARLEHLLQSGPSTIVLAQDDWSTGAALVAVTGSDNTGDKALATASRIASAAALPLTVLNQALLNPGATGTPDQPVDYLADSPGTRELVNQLRQKAVRALVINAELAARYPELIPTVLRKTMSSVVICH